MKYFRVVIAVVVASAVLILTASSEAAPKKKVPKKASAQKEKIADLSEGKVIDLFKANFKRKDIVPDSAAKSPVEGLYEMTDSRGGIVFYYAPKANMIFFGELLTAEMKSLTAAKRNALQQAKLKNIDIGKALVIGSGKHKVIEFTDPDCPYCRKAAEFFKSKDVTKYVFLRPITQLHPKAEEKSKYILNAKDKAAAYYAVMGGKLDKEDLSKQQVSNEAMEMLVNHANVANKVGVKGTPMFWIDGTYVAGANFPAIEALLKK